MTNQSKQVKRFRHDLGKTGCAYINASDLINLIQTYSTIWNVDIEDMIFTADIDRGYYDDSPELQCYLDGERLETDSEFELRIAAEKYREAEIKKKKREENKARLDKLKKEEYETYQRLKSKYER